jgi:hypothetical protein
MDYKNIIKNLIARIRKSEKPIIVAIDKPIVFNNSSDNNVFKWDVKNCNSSTYSTSMGVKWL